MTGPRTARAIAAALLVAALLAPLALAGKGKMRSTELGPKLCETRGGGKFVDIPGFPGEKIDRRLLRDVRFLVKRYSIFVTDGYSTSDVHSINGEHPIGLALDIVPNKAEGGRWRDIDRLAKWAERRQNHPREPFRWVGYDGDAGHGRGHHLHLSWNHSTTKPKRPAATVYSIRCPGSAGGGTGGGGGGEPEPQPEPEPPTGGSNAGSGGGGGGKPSGGIGGKRLAAPVIETGGVDGP
jgi:hypothetical protein